MQFALLETILAKIPLRQKTGTYRVYPLYVGFLSVWRLRSRNKKQRICF